MAANKRNNLQAMAILGPCRPQDICRYESDNRVMFGGNYSEYLRIESFGYMSAEELTEFGVSPTPENCEKEWGRIVFSNSYFRCANNHIFVNQDFTCPDNFRIFLEFIHPGNHIHIFLKEYGVDEDGWRQFCVATLSLWHVKIILHTPETVGIYDRLKTIYLEVVRENRTAGDKSIGFRRWMLKECRETSRSGVYFNCTERLPYYPWSNREKQKDIRLVDGARCVCIGPGAHQIITSIKIRLNSAHIFADCDTFEVVAAGRGECNGFDSSPKFERTIFSISRPLNPIPCRAQVFHGLCPQFIRETSREN